MATAIKAIETTYKGYRFRSRLEARWAVFFDALGIEWEYEKEGYDLGEAGWYLPDFWLPEENMWAEVKPASFGDYEIKKCATLATTTGHPVLMLPGVPEMTSYWFICPLDDDDYGFCDVILGHCKHNFWVSTGDASYPNIIRLDEEYRDWLTEPQRIAVNAARSARFEHGESGAK